MIISKNMKGRIPWNKGKAVWYKGRKQSTEIIKKRIASRKGWKHTEETKLKMSQRKLGNGNPFFNKKHSEETKTKMRHPHKKRKQLC